MNEPKTHFEQVPLAVICEQIARGEIIEEHDPEGFRAPSTSSPLGDLKYPDWQRPFHEALLELDPDKLKERLSAAEAAILIRLQSLGGANRDEVYALEDALSTLDVLRKEIEHPD